MAKGPLFTRRHLEFLLKMDDLLLLIATYEWEHLRTYFQSVPRLWWCELLLIVVFGCHNGGGAS
jgi:hypothetical protein